MPAPNVFMNAHIKSHRQVGPTHADEHHSTVESSIENSRPKVLKQVRSLHIKRNLLQANKNIEVFIGQQVPETDDPFGQVLRRLRSLQGLEASIVASKSCISVWQLYELETGKDTLFYTAGLRTKAAQRVAELLGSDWSDICEGLVSIEKLPALMTHVHVLKTPLTESGMRLSISSHLPLHATEDSHHAPYSDTPFSSALLLRVQDSQSQDD